MRLKTIALTAMTAIASSLGCLASSPTHVCLTFLDGSTTYVDMLASQSPQEGTILTISKNKLLIKVASSTSSEATYTYEAENIKNISFDEYSGIADITADDNIPVITTQADGLILVNGSNGIKISDVNVFDTTGRLMPVEKTLDGQTVTVSLSSLPTGVYIINCLKSTLKVTKK